MSEHNHEHESNFIPAIASAVLLFAGLTFDYWLDDHFFRGAIRLSWYLIAYLLVALPVIRHGIQVAVKGNIFSEFFLMSIATIGAFAIREYPEGVAVMLFYTVGEFFQEAAVGRSKKNIQALLDQRPNTATVFRDRKYIETNPQEISIGEIIQVKAGEKVALDGKLQNDSAHFNTSALTGESRPAVVRRNEMVLAGMVCLGSVVDIKVEKKFEESSFSRILQLTQDAIKQKAPTELFIRKFANVYTPIVVLLACFLVGLPFFFIENYHFTDWLYRALLFLVVSCPCALVISIPLGYFGGIGAASHNGILFKGSTYLDSIAHLDAIAFDKTGTLTEGVFSIQSVVRGENAPDEWLKITAALESKSTHPVAKLISESVSKENHSLAVTSIEEFPGEGIKGVVDGKGVLAGNENLLKRFKVEYPSSLRELVETFVVVAFDKEYVGHVIIADQVKSNAREVIDLITQLGIKEILVLSGDRNSVVQQVGTRVGIQNAKGSLMPGQKMEMLMETKRRYKTVAFAGDGINDAPVLASSDIGIAMGGLGSDVAIETANVVIQSDDLMKIPLAIKIGRETKKIVWQNIGLAFGVKLIVLSLGTIGCATMWEAVFADVGVALLAIVNAIRIQRMF